MIICTGKKLSISIKVLEQVNKKNQTNWPLTTDPWIPKLNIKRFMWLRLYVSFVQADQQTMQTPTIWFYFSKIERKEFNKHWKEEMLLIWAISGRHRWVEHKFTDNHLPARQETITWQLYAVVSASRNLRRPAPQRGSNFRILLREALWLVERRSPLPVTLPVTAVGEKLYENYTSREPEADCQQNGHHSLSLSSLLFYFFLNLS